MADVRRKDYEHTDRAELLDFLDAMPHGFLSFIRPDGSPGLVAVNYTRVGACLYFHGATEGEKMASFAADPRVTFMVADGFSLIPSTWRDPELACPATQFYKAVVVHGEARIVETREEKAAALQSLMEKLQPEGGHRPITATDPKYAKSLDTTAVIAIPLTDMTAKFKFGQNLPKRKRAAIAGQLTERATGRDTETAATMAAVCPFN
ncbi:MAG: pyridoxamine 5'-phosphate oxidase family protein [Dehalococcoidia bacterium]|nr:pyridoxamine 5'-phosphate oxidase family protein [Dehalococcoidia bacterium]